MLPLIRARRGLVDNVGDRTEVDGRDVDQLADRVQIVVRGVIARGHDDGRRDIRPRLGVGGDEPVHHRIEDCLVFGVAEVADRLHREHIGGRHIDRLAALRVRRDDGCDAERVTHVACERRDLFFGVTQVAERLADVVGGSEVGDVRRPRLVVAGVGEIERALIVGIGRDDLDDRQERPEHHRNDEHADDDGHPALFEDVDKLFDGHPVVFMHIFLHCILRRLLCSFFTIINQPRAFDKYFFGI